MENAVHYKREKSEQKRGRVSILHCMVELVEYPIRCIKTDLFVFMLT